MIPTQLETGSERFRQAVELIDSANADDPNQLVISGENRPKEVVHAEMVCAWILELNPDPSEEALLAGRAHHLRRWAEPRADWPPGRAGYLRWRTAQKKRHAAEVADLLDRAGYEAAFIARVGEIVTKTGLGHDPEVQTHEDALCLTFLEMQLGSVTADLGRDKTIQVLAKTMAKMSVKALERAERLPLAEPQREILTAATTLVGRS